MQVSQNPCADAMQIALYLIEKGYHAYVQDDSVIVSEPITSENNGLLKTVAYQRVTIDNMEQARSFISQRS